MEREDPRDAFVSPTYASSTRCRRGAVVGTSSLRRVVLLRALRPDLRIEPLRGNLDTRCASSTRPVRRHRAGGGRPEAAGPGPAHPPGVRAVEMLPAAGQGALGIECAPAARRPGAALAPLAHQRTWLAVAAERAVSRAMGGSCSMPLAAHARSRTGGKVASLEDAGRGAGRPRSRRACAPAAR
jgi:hydroxymethylbilane synthase